MKAAPAEGEAAATTGKVSHQTIVHVVILASAVDGADKSLLPAMFKAMSVQMHMGPTRLGALSFAQSVTFSLALPIWGSLMRFFTARDLMVCGCILWANITFMLACTTHYETQFLLRLLVGFALASISPLAQAIICDVVPEESRGNAFGVQQAVVNGLSMLVSFAATSIAMTTIAGVQGWRVAHAAVGMASLLTGLAVYRLVPRTVSGYVPARSSSWFAEQLRVLRAVSTKPSFVIMVAQGVTGGIPWNAFAFLTLYFQLSGYSDFQAGQVVLWGGIGGVAGSLLAGRLGDVAARLSPNAGRCAVAQTSVVLGTMCFLWLMHIPYTETSFYSVLVANFLFNSVSVWTGPAALRPICGEIFENSQDRAQVLALWCALEGVISAVCGAPLVGFLSELFGYRLPLSGEAAAPAGEQDQSLTALRHAIVGVSLVPWALCALAWVPMYWTYPRDKSACRSTRAKMGEFQMELRKLEHD